jgi:hypothetical protein
VLPAVGVGQLVGERERRVGMALGDRRVAGALGVLDRQPADLGDRARVRQQPARP